MSDKITVTYCEGHSWELEIKFGKFVLIEAEKYKTLVEDIVTVQVVRDILNMNWTETKSIIKERIETAEIIIWIS